MFLTQVFNMFRKETRLIFQKPGDWITILLVPFAFIWIMGTVFGGSGGTPKVAVYLVNEDATGARAAQAVKAMQDSPNLEVEVLSDRAEADRRVGAGERMAAVIIPSGFSDATLTTEGATIELIIDPARDEKASIVTGLVNSALSNLIIDAEVERGVGGAISNAISDLGGSGGISIPTGGEMGNIKAEDLQRFITAGIKGIVGQQVNEAINNPLVYLKISPLAQNSQSQFSALAYLVPGYSLMFVFFIASLMATTVLQERETGALRRLLVTPAPRSALLLGKLLPYFLLAVGQLVFIMLVSSLVFGLKLGSSPLALGIIILAIAAAVTGFGIMVAAIVKTEGQASGLTTLIILVMAVVSGCISPNISIPGLNYATPHAWALQGILNVIARGMGVEGVLTSAAVLFGMAAIFFFIGLKKFKFN